MIYYGQVYNSNSFNIEQLYKIELEVLLLLLLLTIITWLARVLCNLYLCEEKYWEYLFTASLQLLTLKYFEISLRA